MKNKFGNIRGVEANLLDCNIVENEFELQSRNYVHFLRNILGFSSIITVLEVPVV